MSLPAHARGALSSRGIEADESVGLFSNCSMPGLVRRVLGRVGLLDQFDAVVTSVEIGWRKPDRRAFAAVAAELDVPVDALTHVGDDRDADGGIGRYGGRYLHIDGGLTELPDRLAGGEE